MSLPYYPMYPRDFFEGTMELSLEEKGAYVMLLNLMYTRGGPISDEPDYIARYIGCSRVKWIGKKGSIGIRDRLLEAGKLTLEDGMLRNTRADEELKKQASWQQQQAKNGAGSNENKAEEKRPLPQSKSKPEPVVIEVEDSASAQNEFDELQAKCRKWANGSLNLTVGAAHSLDPIIRLLKPTNGEPCIEADVERGITKSAAWLHSKGRQVSSLGYFEKSIIEARDQRLAPLPKPEIHHERAGQGQSGRPANGRGNLRAGAGREHGTAPLDAAWGRLFGDDQAPADVSDEPIDGRAYRLA